MSEVPAGGVQESPSEEPVVEDDAPVVVEEIDYALQSARKRVAFESVAEAEVEQPSSDLPGDLRRRSSPPGQKKLHAGGPGSSETKGPAAKSGGQGTLFGVFLPCFQNIVGVMVFLRLSWIIGEAGALEGFQIVLMCVCTTFTTAVSLSALATNGPVPAGGGYFMVSKFLGPAFAGAVGVLFYVGTSLGVAMYFVGFAEIFLGYLVKEAELPGDAFSMDTEHGRYMNYRVYGSIVSLVSLVVVHSGVTCVAAVSTVALVALTLALLSIFAGLAVNAQGVPDKTFCMIGTRLLLMPLGDIASSCHPPAANGTLSEGLSAMFCGGQPVTMAMLQTDCQKHCQDHYFCTHFHYVTQRLIFPGFSSGTLAESIYNLYGGSGEAVTWGHDPVEYASPSKAYLKIAQPTDMLTLMGIFYPSVTGIMAGANRSGNLKNASHSIPIGTIAAVLLTAAVYMAFLILYVGSIDRLVLRDMYGVSVDGAMIVGQIAWPHHKIPEVGALCSTFAAGLQSLTGAPRLLAAIASDGLFPYIRPLGKLDRKGNPTNALLATFLIAQMGVLIADLNQIASLLSMFFIAFYCLVNCTCLVMAVTNAPNWRPTFKYFHWSVSLVGAVYCLAAMFLISPGAAAAAWGIFFFCYAVVELKGSRLHWGHGKLGVILNFVSKSLLALSSERENLRGAPWRPQLMTFVGLVEVDPDQAGQKDELLNGVQDSDDEERHSSGSEPTKKRRRRLLTVNPDDLKLFLLANQFKQNNGLVICGAIRRLLSSNPTQTVMDIKEMLKDSMRAQGLHGLVEVFVQQPKSRSDDDTFANAAYSLIQLAGISSLRPNIIICRLPESESGLNRVAQVVRVSLLFRKSVMMLGECDTAAFHRSHTKSGHGFIDVVLIHERDTGLMLMLAYLLKSHSVWRRCRLRMLVPSLSSDPTTLAAVGQNWRRYLSANRLKADVKVFTCQVMDSAALNRRLKQISQMSIAETTRLTIMSMRSQKWLETGSESSFSMELWLRQVAERISGIKNVILVWSMSPSSITD